MRKTALGFVFVLAAFLLQPWARAAVVLGHVDNFEDGSTQGWIVGAGRGATHPAPPVNVATGGPGGTGDAFLKLTSLGDGGPGSRMTVINLEPKWAGSYISAGVTEIAMNVNNFGNTALQLRVLFEDPQAGPPANAAFSKTAIGVPAGSGWRHIVFPIAPGDLQAAQGSVLAALDGATAVRIFNSAAPGFPGEPVVASLGVDNIAAVPEPKLTLMLAALLGMLIWTQARRRAHPN